jgi:2,4-dienoyl-CoA reductase-like NADH-dependent reductase (Old Yellow Enzyme family)
LSKGNQASGLFHEVSFLHGKAMPNRFMLAPLTNQQSHDDGTLSDDEKKWLTMRAQGGFGLTMTCAAHVQTVGQGFPGQLGCFGKEHLPGLRTLASDIKKSGSLAFVQLHHAGNRSPQELIGTQPVSASDDPETGARALTTEEVEQVIEDFIAAAVRCDNAGFDGVELHGAHGYLICQFLSSELNSRTDQFGGSLENRARVLMNIIDGIYTRCRPDFTVAVRLSPERFGMKVAEICEVYSWLVASKKVDIIDMSLWDVKKEARDEGYVGQKLIDIFAALPRGDVRLAVAGKMMDPVDAEFALTSGADIVALGRAAILHHNYPDIYKADPAFTPRRTPVAREVLKSEGLSDGFVEYMKAWAGFVAE